MQEQYCRRAFFNLSKTTFNDSHLAISITDITNMGKEFPYHRSQYVNAATFRSGREYEET